MNKMVAPSLEDSTPISRSGRHRPLNFREPDEVVGVSLNTLKKHYPEELELGLARANAVVSGTLFNEAKKGNITACIFWLKTRAGWRETAKVEHSGGTSVEVRQVDATKLSDATLTELMTARAHAPERE